MPFTLAVLKSLMHYPMGTTVDWFKPALLEADPVDEPTWLSDYEGFVSELKVNCGPHDPKDNAKTELENLWMCNNQ
jgi:hypothetical protein